MALTVLYDDLCGKCRRFIRTSNRLDFAGRLDTIGLTDPRIARDYSQFSLEALNFEMHAIDETGAVYKGFYAIRKVAQVVPLMWPLAALLFIPGISLAGEPVYAWIARTRYGAAGPSCEMPPAAPRERGNAR